MMKIYLVRRIETKGLLGIFWAASLEDLWDTIDELGDPSIYEYTQVKKSGALYFGGDESNEPIAVDFPHLPEDQKGDHPEVPWGQAEESETFSGYVYFQSKLKWKPMPFSDEPGGLCYRVLSEVG